jgi:putative membrane protein
MNFIIKLLLMAAGVYVLGMVLPGVHFKHFSTALWFAVVLGGMNAVVKPILQFISLPLTILTLGLFSVVINLLVIQLADYLTPGNVVRGLVPTLIFSVALAVLSAVINLLVSDKKDKD